MAIILQQTFSDVFFLECILIPISLEFAPNGSIENGSVWRLTIIGTNDGLLYWRIYTSLGLDESTFQMPVS